MLAVRFAQCVSLENDRGAAAEERLWQKLFQEPSIWWDNRENKRNPNFPDFRHAITGDPLWLDSRNLPAWLPGKLELLVPPNRGRSLRARFRVDSMNPEQKSEPRLALQYYADMRRSGRWPPTAVFISALKACATLQDFETGKMIHGALRESGQDRSNGFVANSLMDMYARCGRLPDAREVFESISQRDCVSWNCIITRYAESGDFATALDLFRRMQEEVGGCQPNHLTFVAALKACSGLAESGDPGKSLEIVKSIHSQALEQKGGDRELHNFVVNSLVDSYMRCGCVGEARRVFEESKNVHRDIVTWNCFMTRCADAGEGELALGLFDRMQQEHLALNHISFLAAIKACACMAEAESGVLVQGKVVKVNSLLRGRCIHFQTANFGCVDHSFVASSLVDLYSKCGSLIDCWRAFERVTDRNVVSWTAVINGFAENGEPDTALRLFQRMNDEGVSPDALSYVAALRACVRAAEQEKGAILDGKLVKVLSLEKGRNIHAQALESGHSKRDLFLGCSLVDFYSKCGSVVDAWRVFRELQNRNVVAWNCIISGCAECDELDEALRLFEDMKRECAPNHTSYLAVLKACEKLAEIKHRKAECLVRVRSIHRHASAAAPGGSLHLFLASSLVDLYCKCCSIGEARELFERMDEKNLVSWTSLIRGYVESGEPRVALELFDQMQRQGIEPDAVTFVAALRACASIAVRHSDSRDEALDLGRSLLLQAQKRGMNRNVFLVSNAVDFFSKCGSMVEARAVFDEMIQPDVVAWNSIILGYAEDGDCDAGMRMFRAMKQVGVKPNSATLIAVLKAGAVCGDLQCGREVEAEVAAEDITVTNSLVDFYGKYGRIQDARRIFEGMRARTPITWNSLLDAYSRAGHVREALELFDRMREESVEMNEVTFVTILSACGHAGEVEKGKDIFKQMPKMGIMPDVKHYSCVIDLLGRANRLQEAVEMIEQMPCQANEVIWTALLDGARKWNDVMIGKLAFDRLMQLKSSDATGSFALLSNLYSCP